MFTAIFPICLTNNELNRPLNLINATTIKLHKLIFLSTKGARSVAGSCILTSYCAVGTHLSTFFF